MPAKPFHLALPQVIAVFLCSALLAQDAPPPQPSPPPPPPGQTLSPDQLDGLVAPIALYPDPLVSQILVASTYPLEIVQAYQWIERNPGLGGPALTEAAQQQNWDPSIQALVIFPDVMKRLNEDITWTTNLGNAFLAQQPDVMDAIQRMRRQAQEAGKLASTEQQQVVQTTDAGQPVIEIVPANPDVIYVPVYDPGWIWGPPLWYPYPRWYWPPRPGAGVFFSFGRGITIGAYFGGGWGGWGGWGWHPGWGSRTVIVNNTFITRNNFNAGRIANVHGTAVWNHDSFHRQGVPYTNRGLAQRYQAPVRENLRTPESHNAPAAAAQPGERMGNRMVPPTPNNPTGNRGAFGGIENGQAARAHTDHGYSSLGPARTGGGGQTRTGGGGQTRTGGGGGQTRSAPAPRGNPGGGRRQ
ncbi:MAG TPA: DUF3300 domain-containing protein [Candidatus Solibacter sp.]|nr:DUF3300 domain-containing protein [Candidatus Solibacter sp.]